jgi:DNA repair protein RecO (recombination protein O)
VAEAIGAPPRREASGLVAALLQWHLERQLRSLPLVERRAPAGRATEPDQRTEVGAASD